MSGAVWKIGLSRYLPCLRFFACPVSPSSRGVLQFYGRYYDEITLLNPGFSMMLRTTENAMPAVTTELEWTTSHVLQFMIQTGRFRNANGTLANDRIEAAQAYLQFPWSQWQQARFQHITEDGQIFDPEHPAIDILVPGWRDDPTIQANVAPYMIMKQQLQELRDVIRSGPNEEYTRAENALLMCQRIDLWCAGPKEVERAVIHLYKLGRVLNQREVDMPSFITEFVPGADDMADL